MDLNMVLTDMSGAYIEHSIVITNFVATVYNQLKSSICRVYGDNVQYKWIVNGEEKRLIPDATINCRINQRKGNSFFDTPRFVMEVLSPSTEKYDRTEKINRHSPYLSITLHKCYPYYLFGISTFPSSVYHSIALRKFSITIV